MPSNGERHRFTVAPPLAPGEVRTCQVALVEVGLEEIAVGEVASVRSALDRSWFTSRSAGEAQVGVAPARSAKSILRIVELGASSICCGSAPLNRSCRTGR